MLGIMLGNAKESTTKKISLLGEESISYCIFSYFPLGGGMDSRTPQLQPLRAYSFEGTLIATSIKTAEFIRPLKLPKKKLFYVETLEWFDVLNQRYQENGSPNANLRYEDLKKIYLNDDIDLIVSNNEDYKTVSNLFKKPKHIVKDWDFTEIAHEYEK